MCIWFNHDKFSYTRTRAQVFVHERAADVQIRVGVVRNNCIAKAETAPEILGFSFCSVSEEPTETVGQVSCKPGDILQLTLNLDHGKTGPRLTLSLNGAPPIACANKIPSDWDTFVPAIAVRGGSSRTRMTVRDARPEEVLLQDWRFKEARESNSWDTKGVSSNIKLFENSHGHGIGNIAKDPSGYNETVWAKIGFTSGVNWPQFYFFLRFC